MKQRKLLKVFGFNSMASVNVGGLPKINPLGGGGGGLNMACFNFTGSNYASINALSTDVTADGTFTVSMRVKAAVIPVVGYPGLVALRVDDNNRIEMLASVSNQTYIGLFRNVNAGGGDLSAATNAKLTVGEWVIATFVFDTTTYKIFINGVEKYSASNTDLAGIVGVPKLYFGSTALAHYTGCCSDLRIYSAVVTPDHTIPATFEANLVAWYPYPNAAGNARDASGNGNHMTTTGGSLYSASGGPGLPYVTLP